MPTTSRLAPAAADAAHAAQVQFALPGSPRLDDAGLAGGMRVEVLPAQVAWPQVRSQLKMRRSSRLTAIAGSAMAALLLVAGGLLLWGSTYVHNTVTNQLAAQQIYFPPAAAFAHPVAGGEITPNMFKGETLRSMLLNAYGWWKVSQITYIAALIAFGLGGLTALGTAFGVTLGRKHETTPEILPHIGQIPANA